VTTTITDDERVALETLERAANARFWVVCEDGRIRHDVPLSRGDASAFAHWGHCCINNHEIREAR
jgi:hypothetical protein